MTITYPLTAPTNVKPSSVVITQSAAVGVARSPFTFEEQRFRWPGSAWGMEVNLPPMTRAQAEEWIVFALQLQGTYGTFLFGDNFSARLGAGGGTPLVNGGGQTGTGLVIDGAASNITGWLKKGDWVQIGTGSGARLHKCTADVNTNGSGQATIPLYPPLFGSIPDNTPINTQNCVGLFRMADNNTASWNVQEAQIYGFSFKCVQVINDA